MRLRPAALLRLINGGGSSSTVASIWAMRGTETGAPIVEPSSSNTTAYLNVTATGNGYEVTDGYISATPLLAALDSSTTFILAWEGLTTPNCRISGIGSSYACVVLNGNTLYRDPGAGTWGEVLAIPAVTGLNELVVETTSTYVRIWHNGQSIGGNSTGLTPAANWRNISFVGQYLGAPRFTGTIKAAALYAGALFGDVATISPLSYPLP